MRGLAAAALLLAVLAPAAQAEWSKFHNDARNTGYLEGDSYPVFEDVWWNNKTLDNALIRASPVIKDGILVVADTKGYVRGLDAESGAELWRYRMKNGVEGTPAISGERVYVADSKGVLTAINLADGRAEHNATVSSKGGTLGSITIHENKLFIGNEDGEVKAFLASTLTPLWTFSTKDKICIGRDADGKPILAPDEVYPGAAGAVRGAPAVFDGKVFFGSLNHFVLAVDEEGDGNQKTWVHWWHKTKDIIVGAPAVNIKDNQARVVVGSYDGTVYAFQSTLGAVEQACALPQDNTPVWTYEVPTIQGAGGTTQVSKVHSSPAVTGSRVFFGANNGHFYSIDASDGTLEWEKEIGSVINPVTGSPAVAGNIVIIGSQDTRVYWLAADSGNKLKEYITEAAISSGPAIDGVRAFVAAEKGLTYMFGPKVPPRPDLVVTAISATSTQVSVTVQNQGNKASEACMLRIWIKDTVLGDVEVPAITPGNQTSARFTGAVQTGTQVLKAKVDADNKNRESHEGNNELSKSLTVAKPAATSAAPTTAAEDSPAPGIGIVLVLGAMALLRRRRS